MIRVLHVVDRTTGGVPVAVSSYISNSPAGIEHHILSPFDGGSPARVWTGVQAHMHDLGPGTVRRLSRIRRVARAVTADVIHAHSSFAGAYARVSQSRRLRHLVYTPHCYAFERTDISAPRRWAYRAMEKALSHNTSVIAACSPGEYAVARRHAGAARETVYVPNVAAVPSAPGRRRGTGPLSVGMLGRVSTQKDPGYFAAQVSRLAELTSVHPVWIGDGEESLVEELARAGVSITGWLDAAQAAARLDDLDVYLHSAAWEGFPIAVLDAHARGVPVLVRSIAAFAGIDRELTVEHGMDALLAALQTGSIAEWTETNLRRWATYLSANNSLRQRRALRRAWDPAATQGLRDEALRMHDEGGR